MFQIVMGGIAIGANLILGLWVLLVRPRVRINQIFALMSFTIVMWSCNWIGLFLSLSPSSRVLWIKIFSVGLFLVPAAIFHFILAIIESKNKFNKFLFYFSYTLNSFCYLDRAFFSLELKKTALGYYLPVPTLTYHIFTTYTSLLLVYGILLLIFARRSATGIKKVRLSYFLIGATIGILMGLSNFFYIYRLTNYPLGQLGTVIYVLIVGYSIVKYRFLDVELFISRTFAYTATFCVIIALYSGIVVALQNLAQHIMDYGEVVPSVIAVLIIALLFTPLFQRTQALMDRIFLRGRYNYEQVIMEISTTLGSKFSLQELGEYIVTKSASVMGTHQAILFLQGEDDSYFPQAFKGFPQQDWEKLRLPPSLPLIKWLASHKAPFIKGEMQEVISPEVFQKFYGEFEKFLGEITIPLLLKKELRGVLALGRKETEEIYTQRDINLLLTLTQEAAIAIENIRMLEEHQQLLQKQAEAKAREEYIAQIRQKDRELLEAYEELDKARASLSQMKVADEIKDPLTGILGSSQLALEKLKGKVTFDAEVLQKYFKIIEEQTKKIKEILRKFPQPP